MELLRKQLILNEDADIHSINSLNTEIVNRLSGSNEDYIISKKNSRVHSKRISKETRLFLEEFTHPSSLINAVVKYSGKYGIDPESLLTEVYPLIKSFIAYGFLEYYSDEKVYTRKKLYSNGDMAHGYKIISCIQFLDDTETYKASDELGNFVFMKVIHNTSEYLKINFDNELSIYNVLNRNSCVYVPALLNVINDNNYFILVVEWIDGYSLWEIINNNSINYCKKLKVANSIIEAYNQLHTNQILHSDIHPNNFKVLESFEVKMLDFGSSINLRDAKTTSQMRAGIISYYEPELADSILKKNINIVSSPFGEQYQIAALIYHLITGSTYISLSYETAIALKQITTDPPRPFSDFSIAGKNIERVLLKALQKTPSDRYKSWAEFYSQVKISLTEPITILPKNNQEPREAELPIFKELIDSFVCHYGFDSDKVADVKINSPLCSFFHGATGIAYTFYRLSLIKEDPELLSLADIWISKAKQTINVNGAFNNDEIGLIISNIGDNSVFHNKPGILVIEALIKNAQNNDAIFNVTLNSFIELMEQVPLSKKNKFFLDPTQGPASIIFGINILRSICKKKQQHRRLAALNQRIIEEMLPVIHENLTSNKPFKGNNFFGFAHGYAGLLYAIIEAKTNKTDKLKKLIQDSLSILEGYGMKQGKYIYWPVSTDDSSIWAGWCHGTSGHILLWLSAYKGFSNKTYLANAIGAGEYLWKTYKNSTATICCGLAGQSLTFFKLGQITNDKKWFNRGLYLAKCAINSVKNFSLDDSLFQGNVGLTLLSGESFYPTKAIWPLLDSPNNT
jgi:serine/threonine-protein kinase